MRDNTCIVDLPEPVTNIKINNLNPFDINDYDLSEPKEQKKYFFDIERICRNSRSYKRYIDYLREHVSMVKCSFYKNINNIDTYSIRIHIHHTPLTLFDIVNVIFNKRLAMREPLSVNLVAKEVMYVHYKMMVGLIPLSETVHELVHTGFLFIPTDKVFGKYKEFVQSYGQYIPGDLLSTLESAEEYTKAYDYAKETKLLSMQMVHIDPSGAYDLPKPEDIMASMKNVLNDLDSKVTSITIGNTVVQKE